MKYSLLLAGLCFVVFACNQTTQDSQKNQVTAGDTQDFKDSITFSGSSSAAVENNRDTVHTFIRTADLKFKVSNVEKSTYQIEDIITSHGGFVTFTQLNSAIDDVQTKAVSLDSSVETTYFTVTNTMTVRIPNTKLDTTLKDISKLVGYLDYRIIKADDVSLQLQANKLIQKRTGRTSSRLVNAIDGNHKKLEETTAAEELLENKLAQADDALLSNRSLTDQMNFSTVQLSIYQRQTIKTELMANDKNITAYKPGFGSQVLDALSYGLEILKRILIGLIYLWPLIVLAFLGLMGYKKYIYRRSSVRGISSK